MGIIKQDSSSKNNSHTLLSIKVQVTSGSSLIPLLWQDGLWMHLRIQLRVILGLGSCLNTVSSFWTIFYPVILFVASHSIVTNNLGCCQHHSDLLFFLLILFIICSFSPASYKNLAILLLFLPSLAPFSFLSLSLSYVVRLLWCDASHAKNFLAEPYNKVYVLPRLTFNFSVLFFPSYSWH